MTPPRARHGQGQSGKGDYRHSPLRDASREPANLAITASSALRAVPKQGPGPGGPTPSGAGRLTCGKPAQEAQGYLTNTFPVVGEPIRLLSRSSSGGCVANIFAIDCTAFMGSAIIIALYDGFDCIGIAAAP